MESLFLFWRAFKLNLSSQMANFPNLIAGTMGMIINNLLVLWGLWAMLLSGKPHEDSYLIYFLSLNSIVTISWGTVSFCLGGLRNIAQLVEDGAIEPMLATPRHPLVLAALSESNLPSLGDVIQGSLNILLIVYLGSWDWALRSMLFSISAAIGFIALFILAGSVSFFIERGSSLAQLFIECNLSFSFYPSGKMFSDRGKLFLFLLPAGYTSVLPMIAIEESNLSFGILSFFGSSLFLILSEKIFQIGIKKYQGTNIITLRN